MGRLKWTMMVLVVASCGTELEEVPKEAETFVRIEQKVLLAGNDYSYDTWHASGLNQTEINNRSGWEIADCRNSNRFMTATVGFREPAGGLKKYTAKLNIRCTSYYLESRDNDLFAIPRLAQSNWLTVYSASHRPDTSYLFDLEEEEERYINSVRLFLSANEQHVKGVAPYYGEVVHNSNGDFIDGIYSLVPWYEYYWTIPTSGNEHWLMCPPNQAAVGMSIRYDRRNGKIRSAQLRCRALIDI